MSRYNMTARDAYKFAKNRRPEVSPNSSFMRILEEYEQELRQASSFRSPASNNNNLVTNKQQQQQQQQFLPNNDLYHPQEPVNFNSPGDSLRYGNQNNLESYFYNNTRLNSNQQIQAPQAIQQPSNYGFGNSRMSSSHLSLFGFPKSDNYSNNFDNPNLNNKSSIANNFGAYNLNRSSFNRYTSNPSLNMTGAAGGGYDNYQYF